MSKVLGRDADGIQKVITGKEYVGDALGQVSMNTISGLVGQMTYFYTNKVGMAAGVAATVLLIAKLVDALTDLIMGKLVDKTNTKWGKARPWLLWMVIPTLIAIVALFTVPHASEGVQAGYGIITNIFASAIVYTAIAVPYYTGIAYKTRSNEEKGKIGMARSAVGYAVGVSLGIGLIPITNALGGDQAAWIKFAVIMGCISAVCLFVAFKSSRERFAPEAAEAEKESNISIIKGLGILIHNPYWIKITVFGVCMNIMYALIMAAPIYWSIYVAGSDSFYSVINAVNIIPSVIGFVTVGSIIKKFGLVKTAKYASIIGIIGDAVRCFFPTSIPVTLIFGSVVMFATIPLISVLPALVLNTAEYNKSRYGVRITGMTNASNSFVGKIGSGIGGSSVGWILALTGYSADKAPTTAVMNGIYAMNIYIPLAMFIIMLLILARYDLDGEKYQKLVAENEKMDAQA